MKQMHDGNLHRSSRSNRKKKRLLREFKGAYWCPSVTRLFTFRHLASAPFRCCWLLGVPHPLFLTPWRVADHAREMPFGQIRILELRNSERFVQTARFAFSPLTRSLTHVCDGIAQSHENFKVGSNPVRVAAACSTLEKACLRMRLRCIV